MKSARPLIASADLSVSPALTTDVAMQWPHELGVRGYRTPVGRDIEDSARVYSFREDRLPLLVSDMLVIEGGENHCLNPLRHEHLLVLDIESLTDITPRAVEHNQDRRSWFVLIKLNNKGEI